jgi:hypothetical protein
MKDSVRNENSACWTSGAQAGQNAADFFLWLAILVFGAVVLYLMLYFLSVRPRLAGLFVSFSPSGRAAYYLPDYHGMPPKIFAPMYELDRTFLRKNLWRFSGQVWSLSPPTLLSTNGFIGTTNP